MNLIITFIVFGFIGWIIDTGYRSIISKKYAPGTLFPFFAPIYGFGSIILHTTYTYIQNIFFQIMIGTILLILLELITDLFCIKYLKRRLWDYSKSQYNYNGHIDIIHSFYWFLLTIVFRLIFHYLP